MGGVISILDDVVNHIPFLSQFLYGSLFRSKLIFDGVFMPEMVDKNERVEDFFSLTGTSQVAIVSYLATNGGLIGTLVGKDKSTANFDEIYESYVEAAVKSTEWKDVGETDPLALPKGYLHFGNNNNVENIKYFYKNNPFFTASLRDHPDGGFELDPYGESGETYFSLILAPLEEYVVRACARFDDDFKVISATLYTGSKIANRKLVDLDAGDYTENRIAATILYQGTYFAQCVHATTHVLHLLMTVGLMEASDKTPLESWAKPHIDNVYLKYIEVEKLLFSETGSLGGKGENTYHSADHKATMAVNKAMLCEWGSFKSADEYAYNFLFKNIPKGIQRDVICPEFKLHLALMGEYGSEIGAAASKDGLDAVNPKLDLYFKATGRGVSSVDNLKTWAELMAVTGVLHGSTISMTRLFLTTSVLAERSPNLKKFDKSDSSIFTTSIGTILGFLEDYRVFSSTLPSSTIPHNISLVLTKYDRLSTDIKAKYLKNITENMEEFKNYGWILTDHGPNFLDGKQLTLSTYV